MASMGSDVKCLEHSTLKVPYEVLNKKFRAAQKVLDREAAYVASAGNEIERLCADFPPIALSGLDHDEEMECDDKIADEAKIEEEIFSAQSGALPKGIKGEEVSKLLGVLVDRLSSLKRKAGESIQDELEAANIVRKRVQHLKMYNPTPEGMSCSPSQNQINASWKRSRLNRMLVDHLLREGMYNSARKLADHLEIHDLTNIEVFWAAKEVEESLKRHETIRMVAWCYENKSKLRKIKSTLELEIRVQEFIELVRVGNRGEAVKHARKYLADHESEDHIAAVKKCMGLLAFPVNTKIQPYYDLFSEERWEHLMTHFRMDHARLYQLAPTSVLGAVVQAGLAALKTPQCYRGSSKSPNCPVCSEPLATLASILPYAHCAHSQLVCAISGESLNENNPPLLLPSGFVYGSRSLKEMAKANGGKVICPRSNKVYSFTEAEKVYVM